MRIGNNHLRELRRHRGTATSPTTRVRPGTIPTEGRWPVHRRQSYAAQQHQKQPTDQHQEPHTGGAQTGEPHFLLHRRMGRPGRTHRGGEVFLALVFHRHRLVVRRRGRSLHSGAGVDLPVSEERVPPALRVTGGAGKDRTLLGRRELRVVGEHQSHDTRGKRSGRGRAVNGSMRRECPASHECQDTEHAEERTKHDTNCAPTPPGGAGATAGGIPGEGGGTGTCCCCCHPTCWGGCPYGLALPGFPGVG